MSNELRTFIANAAKDAPDCGKHVVATNKYKGDLIEIALEGIKEILEGMLDTQELGTEDADMLAFKIPVVLIVPAN